MQHPMIFFFHWKKSSRAVRTDSDDPYLKWIRNAKVCLPGTLRGPQAEEILEIHLEEEELERQREKEEQEKEDHAAELRKRAAKRRKESREKRKKENPKLNSIKVSLMMFRTCTTITTTDTGLDEVLESKPIAIE